MAIIITEEEHERAISRSRRMYQTDLASNLATAEDRGLKKDEKKGKTMFPGKCWKQVNPLVKLRCLQV